MNFQERYSVLAQKSIKHLDIKIAEKIIGIVYSLNENPFPSISKRCKDTEYRERVFEIVCEEHRILYEIIFEDRIILVHKIERRN